MNRSTLEHIQEMGSYIRDPHMDGFSQFNKKQQLYKILWAAQKQLENAPKFYGEEEWLKEHREKD